MRLKPFKRAFCYGVVALLTASSATAMFPPGPATGETEMQLISAGHRDNSAKSPHSSNRLFVDVISFSSAHGSNLGP